VQHSDDSWFVNCCEETSLGRRQSLQMRRYSLVAIGGGIGSLLRFGISEWMAQMGAWPPLPILIINFSGCFLIAR
jgi:amino acid permease